MKASSLKVASMTSGLIVAAIFAQSKTVRRQTETMRIRKPLAHSGHALLR